MSENNKAKWLDRIRALLAQAEGTNYPAEAETYRARAMELIAQFGIDQALLEADKPTQSTIAGNRVYKVHAPFSKDKTALLSAIVRTLGGRCIWLNKPKYVKQTYTELHVFATEADLERIDLLFTSLLVQCTTEMMREIKNDYYAQMQPRKWKADFIYGFTVEVNSRLSAAERRAQAQAQTARGDGKMSVELVLIDKSKLVDKAVESFYPSLVNRTTRSRTVGAGYDNGRSAGKRADLGDTRISTGGRQAALAG